MIFRAVVAIAAVALLASRDRGTEVQCPAQARPCSAGAQLVQRFRKSGVRSLIEVRKQIERDEVARKAAEANCLKHEVCG